MIASEFIQQSYQEAVGEAEPPSPGEENYKLLFNSGNTYIEVWQNEVGVDWGSLGDTLRLGSPVTATNTFPIDRSKVRKLSTAEDGVKVTGPNGHVQYFAVVKPSQLSKGGQCVALKGNNLKFATAFPADSDLIGGTIDVPYFGYAPKLTGPNSVIPVDNPMWLVYMVAAVFASQDYIKSNQAPRLFASAKNEMDSMKVNNEDVQDAQIDHGSYSPLSETF